MDRADYPFGEFAEFESYPDPGLSAMKAVAGSQGNACYPNDRDIAHGRPEERSFDKPARGTFLDETINLADPEGTALASTVIEIMNDQRSSGRARQARYINHDRNIVRCILANGLRCEWHRKPPIVSYLRKADGYSDKSNKPAWFSGSALARVADLLAAMGLIRLLPGERETASGYEVTAKLLDLCHEHAVSIRSLRRSHPREDLVRLKRSRPDATWDVFVRKLVRHKGDRIYFDPTPQTEKWRDSWVAFNDYIAVQDIEVQLPEHQISLWADELNNDEEHSGQDIYRPELFRNAAYRVFNDGLPDQPSFDRGGRLAGCWWMNAPKEVRPFITINGEPTVELDYNSCHPRMLYHERGLENSGDLYHIPEVADLESAAGLDSKTYRDAVKWVFQVLINGKRRPDVKRCPPDVRLPPDTTPAELAKMIEREHNSIEDVFRTGAGLRLMRIESDIALAVITRARKEGFPALSVHDSFIAKKWRIPGFSIQHSKA